MHPWCCYEKVIKQLVDMKRMLTEILAQWQAYIYCLHSVSQHYKIQTSVLPFLLKTRILKKSRVVLSLLLLLSFVVKNNVYMKGQVD